MKIGNKISILYSGITIGLVVITALIFYVFASNYTEDIYYNYLEQKAHALAEEKFSEDELDPVRYHNVVLRRQNSIPTSKELFINVADRHAATKQLKQYLDSEEIERLFANQTINFREGDEVGTAFIYYDNTGTFAVVVISRNPFIEDINRTLLVGLLILVALSAIVLYFISRLYAIRAMNRIDEDYQTEKMFVNNASHEINNPLTAIQGECEVALMMDSKPEEYKKALTRIQKESNRVIVIMKELLQFSHARNGKMEEDNLQLVSIGEVAEQERKEGVQLDIIHDFQVKVDKELLVIAINNLVSNALKFSKGTPVMVTINKPNIIVQDHGIGIPESEIKHIFQPFYRGSNTTSVSGHGIGLALSKAILERIGARISVSSIVGSGTIFKVTF